MSPEGAPAFAPDVSGALVVYESERGGNSGRDVFATDLRSGRERAVSTAEGPQQQARVSGRRIVWRDTGVQRDGEIHSCLMDFGLTRCDDTACAGPGGLGTRRVRPARALTERDASGLRIAPVRFSRDPRSCRFARRGAPQADRSRGLRPAACSGRAFPVFRSELRAPLRGDACIPRLVNEHQLPSAPALSASPSREAAELLSRFGWARA